MIVTCGLTSGQLGRIDGAGEYLVIAPDEAKRLLGQWIRQRDALDTAQRASFDEEYARVLRRALALIR